MATKLRDLISHIRGCKTASDERTVISQECAHIRTAFKEENNAYRPRCIAKLLFINMLGYPTHFGQMECVKLIASNQFSEKRVGYLGLSQLLDEGSEVLMLVTNSIKYDMQHANQYINALALQALGSIGNVEMCKSLQAEVIGLIQKNNPYIKKKAGLCAMRIFRKVEDTGTEVYESVSHLLQQRNHGVILAGLSLLLALIESNSAVVPQFRPYVSQMVQLLKNAVNLSHSQAAEYDINGIRDPFLQARLMHILRLLAKNNHEASEEISDILAQIATNTTGGKNVDHSVLYECVRTIIYVESEPGLILLGINVLGRFLQNKDSNLRYVALCLLQHVVKVDMKAVQRHRATIMECLSDSDISIRRRALDVTSLLINEDNIKTMTKELLNCLLESDVEFKVDIVAKICMALDRFSPSRQWHVDTLIKVMCLAGNYVQEEVRDTFVNIIVTSPELRSLAVFKLFYSLRENQSQEALVQVAVWCIGEFGDFLISQTKTGGEDYEYFKPVTSTEVLDLLEAIEKRPVSVSKVQSTYEFIVTALTKLTVRFPSELSRIRKMLKKYETSMSLEIQQRACEYDVLLTDYWNASRSSLFERIPITDTLKVFYEKRRARPEITDVKRPSSELLNEKVDLLDLSMDSIPPTSSPAGKKKDESKWKDNMLDELFGPSPADEKAQISNVGSLPLLESLTIQPKSDIGKAAPPTNLLDDFLFDVVDTNERTFPPITVHNEDGLRIIFNISKSTVKPLESSVVAHFTNNLSSKMTDLMLEVAVPNYVQVKVFPIASTVLEANEKNSIQQQMTLTNQSDGKKRMAMRLRVSYLLEGKSIVKLINVSNLPKDL